MSSKRPRSSSPAAKSHEERTEPQQRKATSVTREQGGARLELVPELVDKRDYDPRNVNPNFLHAGSLYIPKNIVQIVTSEDNAHAKSPENVFPSRAGKRPSSENDESIEVKDPELRRYIQRIVRYSGYNPEGAVSTVRKASYDIKQQARIAIQRQGSEEQLEVWGNSVEYDKDETDSWDGLEEEETALVSVEQSPPTSPSRSISRKHLLTRAFGRFKKSKRSHQ